AARSEFTLERVCQSSLKAELSTRSRSQLQTVILVFIAISNRKLARPSLSLLEDLETILRGAFSLTPRVLLIVLYTKMALVAPHDSRTTNSGSTTICWFLIFLSFPSIISIRRFAAACPISIVDHATVVS